MLQFFTPVTLLFLTCSATHHRHPAAGTTQAAVSYRDAAPPSAVFPLGGSTVQAGGSPWTLRNHNSSLTLPATVPGVVHLDLLRANKIPEPYYRYGELELAWIYLEPSWTFSRTIAAGALGPTPGRVLLRSEGLDTMATVTLNGQLVGKTTNMFHRPVWDITSVFKPAAANTLEIRFDSAALASAAAKANYPYPVWGGFASPLQYPQCACHDPLACFTQAKGCECLIQCKQDEKKRMLSTRNFLRKSQAHWGWDWGAGFLTSGIYRELSLVSYNHASVIRDVVVQIFPILTSASASASAILEKEQEELVGIENPTSSVRPTPTGFRVELDVVMISDGVDSATVIRAALPSLGVENSTLVRVAAGEQKVRISLELTDVPKSALWYPNGYGDAVLHNLTVTAAPSGIDDAHIGEASRWAKRIGLKSVELVQEPLPVGLPCGRAQCRAVPTCSNGDKTTCASGQKLQPDGLSMVFRVNGQPVFIKGANWIATDQFEPRIPQRKAKAAGKEKGAAYESAGAGFDALLGSAKAAHYNMLRVWGGGTYERDDFYDVADELGLMIWEEGKFACALYPRDRPFLESVSTEVKDQIRRLSHHASIAVYSGNNENMKHGMPAPAGTGTVATLVDYAALYDETIQTAIRSMDRSRPYWPASPSNGALVDDPDRGIFVTRWGDEKDSRYGDIHTYPSFQSVGRPAPGEDPFPDCEDLSKFQAARFVSEYGFISMESWASMASMTLPTDLTSDGNSSQMFFRMRQSWPYGNRILLGQLGLHFDMPTNPNHREAYKDLTYLSQVVHAHCVTLSSAHYRLQRGSAAGTMGLLFWSLNNQWQGQSDSAVDYTGRWKLLQHASARFYAPVLLHLHSIGPISDRETVQNNTNITTGIVNDTPRKGVANVTIVLRSWATGHSLRSWHLAGPVQAFTSHNFSTAPAAEFLAGHTKESVFMTATATLILHPLEAGGEGTGILDDHGASKVVLSAHHFFSKMKAAALHDPQIRLVFSGNSSLGLTVMVSCTAPAPYVFLDPGVLHGHFDDNGILLLPGLPRTLTFDAMGESVSVDDLRKHVVVRSPWSTQHPERELAVASQH